MINVPPVNNVPPVDALQVKPSVEYPIAFPTPTATNQFNIGENATPSTLDVNILVAFVDGIHVTP